MADRSIHRRHGTPLLETKSAALVKHACDPIGSESEKRFGAGASLSESTTFVRRTSSWRGWCALRTGLLLDYSFFNSLAHPLRHNTRNSVSGSSASFHCTRSRCRHVVGELRTSSPRYRHSRFEEKRRMNIPMLPNFPL